MGRQSGLLLKSHFCAMEERWRPESAAPTAGIHYIPQSLSYERTPQGTLARYFRGNKKLEGSYTNVSIKDSRT